MYNIKFNPMTLLLFIALLFTQNALAKSASQIDAEVDTAIKKFESEVKGGTAFLPKVKGYLVFPTVIKGGFIVGGEYGKGALRINGETKYYYSMASASVGLQAGAKSYAVLIAFISDASLHNFIKSNGWEAGVDGSIAVSDWGKGKNITSMSYEKPIVAFMYDAKGLMASVSIEGTKFQKIIP
ncbi:MAG: hypothetical protein DRQ78_03595 [Epsilonproteobacteria bacterium]|nr:MAG: hypothetical protein DRQ78_03595 [Campylobacterota bacterium]